jgi:O-antigen/teichoic acid export membrane protein
MSLKNRTFRAMLTGGATLISRGITSGAGLISIPLTAQYLGTERFAIWLILSSFLGWASVADLGLASSLTNILASADSNNDQQTAQSAISNTFYLLLILSLGTGILCTAVFPLISWQRVVNVTSISAIADIPSAVIITMLLIILRLILSIPRQIYGAYQEGYIYQIWSTLGSIFAIFGLWIAVNHHGNTALLIATFFGLPLLGDLGAMIYLFKYSRPWLTPKLGQFNWSGSKKLLTTGSQIWVAQISGIIIFQTDIIIVSQVFGATTVATYGTLLKLFAVVGLIQSAFISPLWPAYCESLATGDIRWVETTFQKSIYTSVLWAGITGIALTLLTPYILSSWIGQYQSLGTITLIALLCRTVLLSIDQCIAVLGNGLGLFKLESILAPVFAFVNLTLALTLVHVLGISGIAWATNICVIVFSFIIYSNYCFKKIRLIKKVVV